MASFLCYDNSHVIVTLIKTNFHLNLISQPSFPGCLCQNQVKCSAFGMEMIFHSHANKTHFHKKDCALGLILKLSVSGIRKWPIQLWS